LAAIAIAAALMLNAADAGPPAGKKPGLHIKQAKTVNFRSSSYHVMTDSGGFRWDIQNYGSVYRGKSYSYSGGMYLQVAGTNFQSSNYTGWTNKEGELELGPWQRNNLTIYRRIKAFKKFPVARWLDILENTSRSSVTVQVSMYSSVRYSVRKSGTSSGGTTFGPKDWAIWTKGSSSRGYPTLHVVTSPGAKIRPTVSVSSSQIYTRYNLTIPAGKTVVLCHFESQAPQTATLDKLMKKFPLKALVKDLPGSVRRLIVNMKVGGGVEGVELERHEKSDRVSLANGDLMLGTIENTSFKVSTLLGDMDLPADDLMGMVAGKKPGRVRFVTTDGQVIGAAAGAVELSLKLPSGGKLTIPLAKTKDWSYRISKEKPDDVDELGPYAALDTGDILAIDAKSDGMKLQMKTACGPIDLAVSDLLEIRRNRRKDAKTPYVAAFVNGSEMSGEFADKTISLPLKLGGRKVDAPSDKLDMLFFSEDDKPQPDACRILLAGGDRLLGQLSDKGYKIATDFGQARVDIKKLRRLTFAKSKPDGAFIAAVELLNGTVLRGRLDKDKISYTLAGRIKLNVPIGIITSITLPEPPEAPDKDDVDPKVPPVLLPPIPGGMPVRVFNGPVQLIEKD